MIALSDFATAYTLTDASGASALRASRYSPRVKIHSHTFHGAEVYFTAVAGWGCRYRVSGYSLLSSQ